MMTVMRVNVVLLCVWEIRDAWTGKHHQKHHDGHHNRKYIRDVLWSAKYQVRLRWNKKVTYTESLLLIPASRNIVDAILIKDAGSKENWAGSQLGKTSVYFNRILTSITKCKYIALSSSFALTEENLLPKPPKLGKTSHKQIASNEVVNAGKWVS